MQLLGDLFSDLKLADDEFGRVVSLDQIYEIQHTALDSDTQSSMARIMNKCAELKKDLALRAAKAVALLEMIQEAEPTTPSLLPSAYTIASVLAIKYPKSKKHLSCSVPRGCSDTRTSRIQDPSRLAKSGNESAEMEVLRQIKSVSMCWRHSKNCG